MVAYSLGCFLLPFLPNANFAVKIFSVANNREATYIMTNCEDCDVDDAKDDG